MERSSTTENESGRQQNTNRGREAPLGMLLSLALSEFILEMTLMTARNPLKTNRKAVRQLGRELLLAPQIGFAW